MKFSSKSILATPEILKRKLGAEYVTPITLGSTAFTSGVCKAGNPIDADGKVSNDGDAIGILLNDVYDENPNGALIKGFAVINKSNGQSNTGLTYATAMISALEANGIIFE